MRFKENIQFLMASNDVSMTDLSKATSVPLSTLHGWTQGVEPKKIEQVKNVADFFGVTLDFIFYGIESEEIETENNFKKYDEDIMAGVYEVILRPVKKKRK